MRLQTEAAVDANGKPIPVFVPDTKATVDVTLNTATTTSSPASTTFGATSKTFPSCSLLSSSTGTVLITSKLGGADGCNISVTVATAAENQDDAVIVSVSGKDITITPDNGGNTMTQVAAAITAHEAASKLVTAVVVGTGSHTLTTNAKQYLRGWDAGMLGTLVRCYNSGDHVCFIGLFPESDFGTPTASMPIASGTTEYIMVGPGEKIVARGTATEHLYLTPMRKY